MTDGCTSLKHDGFRIVAHEDGESVRLWSRNGRMGSRRTGVHSVLRLTSCLPLNVTCGAPQLDRRVLTGIAPSARTISWAVGVKQKSRK
jgi:hypothetical protein